MSRNIKRKLNKKLRLKKSAYIVLTGTACAMGIGCMLIVNSITSNVKEKTAIRQDDSVAASMDNQSESVSAKYYAGGSSEGKLIVCTAETTNITTAADENSEVAGTLGQYGVASVVSEDGDWCKIISGEVEGFAPKSDFAFGEDAAALEDKTQVTVANVNSDSVNFRADSNTDADVLCVLSEGVKGEVVSGEESEWVEISLDGVGTGYTYSDYVEIETKTIEAVTAAESANQAEMIAKGISAADEIKNPPAEEVVYEEDTYDYSDDYYEEETYDDTEYYSDEDFKVEYAEEEAYYEEDYSDDDSDVYYEEDNGSSYEEPQQTWQEIVRTDLVDYACSFAGWLPYVWGGHSLEYGADCSGFTAAVFARYNYDLSYASDVQQYQGRSVSLSEALPGDILVYYGHVAIYIGNGMKVHSPYPGTTVTIDSIYYDTILDVRRIIE